MSETGEMVISLMSNWQIFVWFALPIVLHASLGIAWEYQWDLDPTGANSSKQTIEPNLIAYDVGYWIVLSIYFMYMLGFMAGFIYLLTGWVVGRWVGTAIAEHVKHSLLFRVKLIVVALMFNLIYGIYAHHQAGFPIFP